MEDFPTILNANSKVILARRGFNFLGSEARSFYAWWTFESEDYCFVLAVDRGCFEASLSSKHKASPISGGLIHLLRHIKKDDSFYEDRLVAVARYHTLMESVRITVSES